MISQMTLIVFLQCCVGHHPWWRTPIWWVEGGHTTTSIPWCATSALKGSSSVTFPPLAAGLTAPGRDPESSAKSVSIGDSKRAQIYD